MGERRAAIPDRLAAMALCPRCFGTLHDASGGSPGPLVCAGCSSEYPVLSGVPLLAVVDSSWGPIIGETIARAEIERNATSDVGVERDRQQKADDYHEMTWDLMDRLFEDAFDGLDVGGGKAVLDVGAGDLSTGRKLAERGAWVVATDVHLGEILRHGGNPDPGESGAAGSVLEVMADAHRLPFEDGSFDVTYCRSTIHHLAHPRAAIKEMARVTRPGGKVVLASEPVASILDRRPEYLDGVFDYEEGLNEHVFPVTRYTLPLRLYCRDVTASYFLPGVLSRGAKVYERLHIDHSAHFHEGERLSFVPSLKLLFSGASANFSGTRSGRRVTRPAPLPDSARIAAPEQLWVRDRRDEDTLRELWRSLLEPSGFDCSLDLAEADCGPPNKGWRAPQESGENRFRFTGARATLLMRNDTASSHVALRMLGYPAEAGRATGSISVDAGECCRYALTEFDTTIRFAKPPGMGEVFALHIENDFTYVPDELFGNGDTRELGVGVVRIWQE